MPEVGKCRWTDQEHKCEREATHDGGTRCIFHAKVKLINEFESSLKGLIKLYYRTGVNVWDFRGFVFEFDDAYDLDDSPFITALQESECDNIEGEAIFDDSIFETVAHFNCIEFKDRVSFRSAKFKRAAFFSRTVLCQGGDFTSAVFEGDADFRSATFNGDMGFESTAFSGNADFSSASFSQSGNFRHCIIKSHVIWTWPGDGKKQDKEGNTIERGVLRFTDLKFEDGGILDLRKNFLQNDSTLEIQECDMRNILIEGNDCTQITFSHNRWPIHEDLFDSWFIRWLPLKYRKAKRNVIGDEYQIGRLKDYYPKDTPKNRHNKDILRSVKYDPKLSLIRQTYHKLAKLFHDYPDHQCANEFERGAFEMWRLEARKKWKKADNNENSLRNRSTYIFLSCYKYFSNYGGNLGLPLIWWLLLMSVCAFAYGVLTPGVIWGELSLGFMLSRLAESFCSACIFVSTTNNGDAILTIKVFQNVASAIIIALFLHDIRRRFKH